MTATTHRLDDGTKVLVRPIRNDDAAALLEGMRRMSIRSRIQRFLGDKTTLSKRELDRLTNCDGVDHIALVLAVLDGSTEECDRVAVARCVRDHDEPDLAEVAVTVIDDWQGRGVGTLLARRLSREALKVGIRRWQAFYLADNPAAVRILSSVAVKVSERPFGFGAVEATYELVGADDEISRIRRA